MSTTFFSHEEMISELGGAVKGQRACCILGPLAQFHCPHLLVNLFPMAEVDDDYDEFVVERFIENAVAS